MICRLCLMESQDYLQIYSDAGEVMEAEAIAIIAKFFYIELQKEDVVSNKICMRCWKHVNDFHKFCTDIIKKQEALIQQLECRDIKNEVAAVNTEIKNNPLSDKDTTLFEPEIDMYNEISEPQSITPPADPVEDNASEPNRIRKRAEYRTKNTAHMKRERKNLQSSKNATDNLMESNIRKNDESSDDSGSTLQHSVHVTDVNNTKSSSRKNVIQETDAYIAENAQLTCCICAVPLNDFKHLKKHFRQDHQCNGYAICCAIRFEKRTLYFDHLRAHKDPNCFKCTKCNNKFSSRRYLKQHTDTMHPAEGTLQFQCNLCPRKFSKQYILDCHIRSLHSTVRNHKCGECDKSFKNNWALKQHLKTVHLNESEWVCDMCGKQLKTAQNLALHIEVIHNHSKKSEVQCEVCFKFVKNARCLSKHMTVHREEASGIEFKCKHCDITKLSRRALADHIRYHHSSKIYKCTTCDKEFKRNRSLLEHISTHMGKPVYKCLLCPESFKSPDSLLKHKTDNH